MKFLILFAFEILLVFAQPEPSPVPDCNPFNEVCPGVDCDQGVAGQILFESPTDGTYSFLNQPINITISFTENTDTTTVQDEYVIYYRQVGDKDWNRWGTMPVGTTTVELTLRDIVPGSYEMILLGDGYDRTRVQKLGPEFTCIPNGWPFSPPHDFRVLSPRTVQPYVDKLPPNSSGAYSAAAVGFEILLALLII